MDPTSMEMKRRKLEDNGVGVPGAALPAPAIGLAPATGAAGSAEAAAAAAAAGSVMAAAAGEPSESNGAGVPAHLTRDDARLMVDLLSKEALANIVIDATLRHHDVLEEVRKLADRDPSQRKIFVRGLGWETNTLSLHHTFAEFGELEEAIAIMDKNTGKSRGYGFVTYKHMDGAINALKEPSKRIDGRIGVCQLASTGPGSSQPPQDLAARKIYVGNVPLDWPVDRILGIFAEYGEIEEGPLGLDKQAGKARGFALFIYKSPESAKRALEEPVKNFGGHPLFCKLAVEGAKQRANMQGQPDMSELATGQPGGTGPPPLNMPYGGAQYGAAPQGMMTQGVPYSQNSDPTMNTGLNPVMNHAMNLNMHPNAAGPIQSRPVANNPSMPSSMNPSYGQAVNPGVSQARNPMGLPPYATHGVVDPYGQQVASYGGQHGAYSGVGAQTSMYNAAQGSIASQTPVLQGQGQYGIPPYQSHQQLLTPYQSQQQTPISYQSQQQVAASSVPRVQPTGGVVPSMPYYGM